MFIFRGCMHKVSSKKGTNVVQASKPKIVKPTLEEVAAVASKNDRDYEKVLENYDLNPKNLQALIARLGQSSTEEEKISTHSLPKRSTTFLIIGDLHMNSADMHGNLECDYDKWKKVLQIGKDMGAQYVLQTGDVTDGENMRPFQKYYLNIQGFDDVIKYCVDQWPVSGLPTFFIGGNHDESYVKTSKADICKWIAKERDDLHYLGMNEGNLPLQPEYQKMFFRGEKLPKKGVTWIRIRHPSDGSAEGRSYKAQKHANALVGDAKPNILIIGHYHKQGYTLDRNVHVIDAGTMQKQSEWMRTKNLQAHLLGTLITAYYHQDGTIAAFDRTLLEYEVNGTEGFKSQVKW